MTKIKKFLSFLISIAVIIILVINFDKITDKFSEYISNLKDDRTVKIKEPNEYYRVYTYKYVKNSKNYIPTSYNDLKDIFYSTLNNGWEELTFYCPEGYTDCLEDVKKISDSEDELANINNFVHPYNSYSSIKTIYDDTGMITIKVNHLYNRDEIEKIDKDIDSIIEKYVNNTMNTSDKIRAVHDAIINMTKYDVQRAEKKDSPYDSARIQGVLYDHYAICSGYADTMAVALDKLGIPNYKISSETHVWNVVYVNGSWKHLDLTWDDPVTASGNDTLEHKYFLITSERLKELDDKNQHSFDPNVYLEV